MITAYPNRVQEVHENFLIDIDAPFTWHDCAVQWDLDSNSYCDDIRLCIGGVYCEDDLCTDARTTYSYHHNHPVCPSETNTSTFPCKCSVNVVNPVTKSCGQGLLNYDDAYFFNTTNGRNVFTVIGRYTNAVCAPSTSFASFPANVTGVMSFSSSPYALPAYVFPPFKNSLALCLPRTLSSHGVLFIGEGPYYLLPQSDVDVRSYLSYIPLLKNQDSSGYYISVNSIVIKYRSIIVPTNTTAKLSTIDPYTTLRTEIYNNVIKRFSKVVKRIPSAKAVAPFSVCFSTLKNDTKARLTVPDIDLVLHDGKKWTISTANSIKQVTKDVACLALVDGGATSEPAIVIGTFQLEDNFLVFDLENFTLGFSSSLLYKHTSCSNFNFTLTKKALIN
ncbi:gamma conglutin 1-like [Rutidosis leptorrhynchoides]|uniref:gamma conglutin 1-like n=1 Tax=Rutidosis leptorrhynchoides TaxID=125765 RepID=UPI003A99E903